MPQVHKFDTANAAGGRQFVAHKVYIGSSKFSVWFSDHDGGSLVDAERIDAAGRSYGVRRSAPAWQTLSGRVAGLLAQYDREHAA